MQSTTPARDEHEHHHTSMALISLTSIRMTWERHSWRLFWGRYKKDESGIKNDANATLVLVIYTCKEWNEFVITASISIEEVLPYFLFKDCSKWTAVQPATTENDLVVVRTGEGASLFRTSHSPAFTLLRCQISQMSLCVWSNNVMINFYCRYSKYKVWRVVWRQRLGQWLKWPRYLPGIFVAHLWIMVPVTYTTRGAENRTLLRSVPFCCFDRYTDRRVCPKPHVCLMKWPWLSFINNQ